MGIEFYKINEIYAHKYYKVPKDLFDSSRYRTMLNSDAKLLYALLLDRMELSRDNGWVNELGEIYLIYTRDALCDMLGLCRNTMTRAFMQLSDTGLIFEKRQGRGLPNLIFIGKIQRDEKTGMLQENSHHKSCPQYPQNPQVPKINVPSDSQILRIKKRKKCESRIPKNEHQDSQNLRASNTDIIKTDISKTENSLSVDDASKGSDRQTSLPPVAESNLPDESGELQSILKKCELYIFNNGSTRLILQNALEIMYFSEYVKIGTAKIPQNMVRSRMHLLHGAILEYALGKIRTRTENTTEIRNSTNYLVAAIYNAISEYHSDVEVDPELNRYLNST